MKKRLLSLVLCLVMVFSLFPAFGMTAAAADANGITNPQPQPAQDASEQLNLTKNLTPGQNGTYDITMESWATGEVKAVEEKIPTDFVVVVDQSGSMKEADMPSGNPTVRNNVNLETVAGGAYYYKDGDHYYRVYGEKDYLFRYYEPNHWWVGGIIDRLGTRLRWFMGNTSATTTFANQLYFREVVNGKPIYQPITMTVSGEALRYDIRFRYHSNLTNSDVYFNREDETYMNGHDSPWYHSALGGGTVDDTSWRYGRTDDAYQGLSKSDEAYPYAEFTFIKGGMFVNYPMYDRHVGYTKLCYRDVNGVEHELPSNQNGGQTTWEYCDDDGIARSQQAADSARPTYSGLYTFPSTGRRIEALKTALTEFAEKIANETDSFGAVDNRVSIVGFSSDEGTYKNTELLTGTTFAIQRGGSIDSRYGYSADGYNHNGKMKSDATAADYAGALVSATSGSVGTVNSEINDAIDAVTAYGGTQPEDGLDMAYNVLTNRGEGLGKTTYQIRSGSNKDQIVNRNTVVIFFTDGRPGNYDYSNQYAEANEVVESAAQIKGLDVEPTIFSIGVFGESDGNPLTYDGRNDYTTDPQGNQVRVSSLDTAYWEYLGGWVQTLTESGTTYCLRRQWRPNNAEGYTPEPNDTIYDYMSVVSSNYPDAQEFITQAWLNGNHAENYDHATNSDEARNSATAETTNKYYRMASNQQTLIEAFLQAATMNNSETETGVKLDATAVFKDKVNLSDFDLTGATYTVKWQPVKMQNGQIVNNGTAATKVNGAAVPADGQINYSGFDYSGNYVSDIKDGMKLIVTINGLTPKHTGRLTSNEGNAGVYGQGETNPTVSIASPTLDLAGSNDKTYIIDFSAAMKVAENAKKLGTTTGTNGEFTQSGSGDSFDVTYKLNGGLGANNNLFEAEYSGVDTAMVYGSNSAWAKITTVPANNIYYDDDLTQLTATETGSGFNSGIVGADSANDIDKGKQLVFTFTGDRIDIFCNTTSSSNFFSANLYGSDGATAAQDVDGKSFYLITGASTDDLANIPVLSVRMRTVGTYVLKLNVGVQTNFSLDGVRVYNTMGKNADAASAYIAAKENNATFTQVRQILLNTDKVPFSLPEGMDSVIGALYRDKDKDQPYAKSGPKNEVYLDGGTGDQAKHEEISFIIDGYNAETQKIMIGLSAPKSNTVSAESPADVLVTYGDGSTTTLHVQSQTHMYYEVTPTSDGKVVIKNTSSTLISIDNVKITDNQPTRNVLGAPKFMVNRALLAYADEFDTLPVVESNIVPEDPGTDPGTEPGDEPGTGEEPSPEPTHQPSLSELIQQFFSNFVKNLFGSISRLFGN